jgi:deoxyhypusine synthase
MANPYLSNPVNPFQIDTSLTAGQILERMAETSFQGRNLGTAWRLWQQMVTDDAFIFFGLAGAMVPAGMRRILVFLLQNGLIHCLVSTGANLFHDCHETLGRKHFKGSAAANDDELRKQQVDRIYDTFASDLEFQKTDDYIAAFGASLKKDRSYTTREFLHLLGQRLSRESNEDGILTAAAKAGVPIYCPALGDSSIAIALAVSNKEGPLSLQFDIVADVRETADLAANASSTGVIYVGGGTPKNFIQQTEVTAALRGDEVSGHRYAIQITADAPHWGGLSGCTFAEAQSWGKISADARKVSVHCDATIALPLLASAMAEWLSDRFGEKPRKEK